MAQPERRPVDFIDYSMPGGMVLIALGIGDAAARGEYGYSPFDYDLRPLMLIGIVMAALGAIRHQVLR